MKKPIGGYPPGKWQKETELKKLREALARAGKDRKHDLEDVSKKPSDK